MFEEPNERGDPPAGVLEACRRGEPAGFAALFDACGDRVFALAARLCGNRSEAADITQDVFLKLIGRVDQFRAEARFSTWLHRVVVNTFLDRRRARRRLVPLDDPEIGPRAVMAPQQEADVLRAERTRRVNAALARVPEDYRIALALRYTAGMSYEEIAEATGVAPGTVASRLSRGLRDLGRALGKEGR
jgi:RNA polymerase sigma-70 factor, ECF subfamily